MKRKKTCLSVLALLLAGTWIQPVLEPGSMILAAGDSEMEPVGPPIFREPDDTDEAAQPEEKGWKDGRYLDANPRYEKQDVYGSTFRFEKDGTPRTGLVEGACYDEGTGALIKNETIELNGTLYVANEAGQLTPLEESALIRESAGQDLQGVLVSTRIPEPGGSGFAVVRAASSSSAADFSSLADQTLRTGNLLVLTYDFQGEGKQPEQEAFNFYQAVKPYLGKALPVLNFETCTAKTGVRFVSRFVDAFNLLSHVPLAVHIPTGVQQNMDLSLLKSDCRILDSLTRLSMSRDEFEKAIAVRPQTSNDDMFRLYNPNSGEHFYTSSDEERDTLVSYGWHFESLGWTAPKNGKPVYRLYNPNAGDHHYTLDAGERAELIRLGWIDENIGWYSSSDQKQAVWRAYNPNAQSGAHHFTTAAEEIAALSKMGWKDEGLAWYGTEPSLKPSGIPDVPYRNSDYCYNSNGVKLTGAQNIDGKMFYFDPAQGGKLYTGTPGNFTLTNGETIRVNQDGSLYTGPVQEGNRLRWFQADSGYAARNKFLLLPADYNDNTIDFVWFDENGYADRSSTKRPDTDTEARLKTRINKQSWLVDPATGARILISEYLKRQYDNPQLSSFMEEALRYQGWPYVWAGKSPDTGFDCSGLITWCMKTQWNTDVDPIMTNAKSIYERYCDPLLRAQERPGDLVFWRGTYGSNPNYISHVGIYCGNGWVYCAGDPIDFYPVNSCLRPDGTVAPWFFGRPKSDQPEPDSDSMEEVDKN